jgi:hypothetical protein
VKTNMQHDTHVPPILQPASPPSWVRYERGVRDRIGPAAFLARRDDIRRKLETVVDFPPRGRARLGRRLRAINHVLRLVAQEGMR